MNETFERAVEEAKILKVRPGKDELSELYGLYKQATAGDVTGERPGILDFAGRLKWDARNKKRGLTQDEAQNLYVELVETLKVKYGI